MGGWGYQGIPGDSHACVRARKGLTRIRARVATALAGDAVLDGRVAGLWVLLGMEGEQVCLIWWRHGLRVASHAACSTGAARSRWGEAEQRRRSILNSGLQLQPGLAPVARALPRTCTWQRRIAYLRFPQPTRRLFVAAWEQERKPHGRGLLYMELAVYRSWTHDADARLRYAAWRSVSGGPPVMLCACHQQGKADGW